MMTQDKLDKLVEKGEAFIGRCKELRTIHEHPCLVFIERDHDAEEIVPIPKGTGGIHRESLSALSQMADAVFYVNEEFRDNKNVYYLRIYDEHGALLYQGHEKMTEENRRAHAVSRVH